jgi:predicted small secreted protein
MDTLKKIALSTFACVFLLIAPGCNTFKGLGRDLQKGGEAVEGAAETVESEIRN